MYDKTSGLTPNRNVIKSLFHINLFKVTLWFPGFKVLVHEAKSSLLSSARFKNVWCSTSLLHRLYLNLQRSIVD
jgi:hypothetical protein